MNSFDIVADRDLRAPLPESFCFIDGENETQMGKDVPRDPQGLEDPNYRLLLLRKKKPRGSGGLREHPDMGHQCILKGPEEPKLLSR